MTASLPGRVPANTSGRWSGRKALTDADGVAVAVDAAEAVKQLKQKRAEEEALQAAFGHLNRTSASPKVIAYQHTQ